MASIRKQMEVSASPADIWDAVRDFGQVHLRLGPGFVIDCTLEGDARIVTFTNGTSARELLVDVDDESRRLVYAIVSDRLRAHSASMQVFAKDEGSRLVWITDVLPNDIAGYIDAQMQQAMPIMKRTLEGQ